VGAPLPLEAVQAAIEALAPPALAAPWDNTGLLVRGTRGVGRIGLTIDLTGPVLDELSDCDLIVAYHPLLFKGLKRVDGSTGVDRALARLIRAGQHLSCPHTAMDAVPGGMGDWLADAVGPHGGLRPIEPSRLDPRAGMGRRAELITPAPLRALLPGLLARLGVANALVAGDLDAPRARFAVCPGAGGDLFAPLLGEVDLLVTGELRHHDVLAFVEAGAAVVLTQHTRCERGYLPIFADRLRAALPGVDVRVSAVDADPLSPWPPAGIPPGPPAAGG
jgi:dinuclear metal center YbgI/SA1388 family protein